MTDSTHIIRLPVSRAIRIYSHRNLLMQME